MGGPAFPTDQSIREEVAERVTLLRAYFPPESIYYAPADQMAYAGAKPTDTIDWEPRLTTEAIQSRLSAVLGPHCWGMTFTSLPARDGLCSVKATITVGYTADGGAVDRVAVASPLATDRETHAEAFRQAALLLDVGKYLTAVRCPGPKQAKTSEFTLSVHLLPADCQPCGKVEADKIYALVLQCAKLSGGDVAAAAARAWDRLYTRYGYRTGAASMPVAAVQKRHAAGMIKTAGDWLSQLAADDAAKKLRT